MNGKTLGIVIVLAVMAAAVGLVVATAGAGQNSARPKASNARSVGLDRQHDLGRLDRRSLGAPGPGWLKALKMRSDALNKKYGLGIYARTGAANSTTPAWLKALNERSDALNKKYGLGIYARTGAANSTTPAWLKALNERSDALNRKYRLGNYATR